MKRRVQESERALRLKQDSDRRIVELRNDIDSMKKNKISLLRKMRDDADRQLSLLALLVQKYKY